MGADVQTHSQTLGGTLKALWKKGRKGCRNKKTPAEHSLQNQLSKAHRGGGMGEWRDEGWVGRRGCGLTEPEGELAWVCTGPLLTCCGCLAFKISAEQCVSGVVSYSVLPALGPFSSPGFPHPA